MATRQIQTTYRVDHTTVTVEAPNILATSTKLASLTASASVEASTGSSIAALGGGPCPSFGDDRDPTAVVPSCSATGTISSIAGGGLTLLSAAAHRLPNFLVALINRV
jgi:hypothetical protein